MYGKACTRLMGVRQAYGKRLLMAGLFAVLAVGLTGCNEIIGASPNTKTIVEMRPSDKVQFKVEGPKNSLATWCEWTVEQRSGDNMIIIDDVLRGQNQFEFETKSGEGTNRKIIHCFVWQYGIWGEPGPMMQFNNWHIGWHILDSRSWEVRIHPDDTAPIFQGNYFIRDSTDVQLLNGYTEITGFLSITEDIMYTTPGNVTSLVGLGSLTTIGGSLRISDSALTDLSGLDNLIGVGGNVVVLDNSVLEHLTGLQNLKSVGGNMLVEGNKVLLDLFGLENISTIGGDLEINYNYALSSLDLNQLNRVEDDFIIYNNHTLCTLLAEELRDQVLSAGGIGGTISISGNKECTTP